MKNIFVGNLAFNTTEDELRSMFESYGRVDRVSLMTDRDTGRSRGFAFVEMADEGEAEIRARCFAPLHGIAEDPATGSANIALAGLLASLRPEADLALSLRIAQGVEMGRPSLLEAAAEKRDGGVVATRIGGRCVKVMAGTIEV